MMENREACPVKNKIDRISRLLGDVIPNRSEVHNNGNVVESCVRMAGDAHSYKAFVERVSSFVPGHWGVREVTPLQCAQYGWKLIEPDVMQCGTCKQIVCASLPPPSDRYAYGLFLDKLKEQIVCGHHEACWWRHNPCPLHSAQPLHITTYKELHDLLNTANILEGLKSALPYLDTPTLMVQLGVDDMLLGKFHSAQTISPVQRTAALLTLCGWSRGDGEFLRCKGCCRSVGLWSFVTQDDEIDPNLRSSETQEPISKKYKSSESESPEEENLIFTTPEDSQAQWRMRLRERRVSEQSSSDESHPVRRRGTERARKSSTCSQTNTKEESAALDVTNTSSIYKQKIQKEFFHPLEEHRSWCPWVVVQDEGKELKGYQRILSSVKDIINQSEGKNIHLSKKIGGNVQGIRLLRRLLDNLETEDLQQME